MESMRQEAIEATDSCLVRSGKVPGQTLSLGPLDWINACDYPSQLFVYRTRLDADALKRSLQRLLLDFPLFAGHCVVARDGIPSIQLSDAGVRFTEQRSPLTLREFIRERGSATQAGEYSDKIPPFKSASVDPPLLAIRLTHLNGGGSVLGVTHFHGVCDGGGMFQFFSAWSRAIKGEAYPPPVLDRSVLGALQRSLAGEQPSAFDSFPAVSLMELMQLFARIKNLADRSQRQVVHFSGDLLATLKRRALQQGSRPSRWFSTQDLLVAHLWHEVSSAQTEAAIRLSYILDLRGRHGFDVPDAYIGNAHSIRCGAAAGASLQQGDIVSLAQTVREISDTADAHSVGQDMAYLARRIPGSNKLHLTESALRPTETLTVNNLSNLPCYDLDLGGGSPVWYVPPEYPGCRIAHIVPAAPGDGGFDVHLKLDEREMAQVLARHHALQAA
jgi:shikimate O-hydroxycinnamoyltransferase